MSSFCRCRSSWICHERRHEPAMTVMPSRRSVVNSPVPDSATNKAGAGGHRHIEEIPPAEQAVPALLLVKVGEAVNVQPVEKMLLEHVPLAVSFGRHGALHVIRPHFLEIDKQHDPDLATRR